MWQKPGPQGRGAAGAARGPRGPRGRRGTADDDARARSATLGALNRAGYPKNQYVRPYMKRDGSQVAGYWRNSSTDGLPTCRVVTC